MLFVSHRLSSSPSAAATHLSVTLWCLCFGEKSSYLHFATGGLSRISTNVVTLHIEKGNSLMAAWLSGAAGTQIGRLLFSLLQTQAQD